MRLIYADVFLKNKCNIWKARRRINLIYWIRFPRFFSFPTKTAPLFKRMKVLNVIFHSSTFVKRQINPTNITFVSCCFILLYLFQDFITMFTTFWDFSFLYQQNEKYWYHRFLRFVWFSIFIRSQTMTENFLNNVS